MVEKGSNAEVLPCEAHEGSRQRRTAGDKETTLQTRATSGSRGDGTRFVRARDVRARLTEFYRDRVKSRMDVFVQSVPPINSNYLQERFFPIKYGRHYYETRFFNIHNCCIQLV